MIKELCNQEKIIHEKISIIVLKKFLAVKSLQKLFFEGMVLSIILSAKGVAEAIFQKI